MLPSLYMTETAAHTPVSVFQLDEKAWTFLDEVGHEMANTPPRLSKKKNTTRQKRTPLVKNLCASQTLQTTLAGQNLSWTFVALSHLKLLYASYP
jgi:hypothetical protein